MIEFRNVTKRYDDRRGGTVAAIQEFDLTIADGETVCLIGPSGCGKTTAVKLVNRLIEPTSGQVLLDGKEIRNHDLIALRRRIGYVIQTGGLFPHLTVAENVGLLCGVERWPPDRTAARVDELLHQVNLEPNDFRSRYPRDLSGGQRQRVGVARALALDPSYLLMDEPFGALDPITRDLIQREFHKLKAQVGKTVVFVTHDLAEAFLLGDRIALMDTGSLVQVGTQDDFRERPANAFVLDFLKHHLRNGGSHA